MLPGRRFTVRRQSDGQLVVEDSHSGEQTRVVGLAGIGEQIGRWLDAADADEDAPQRQTGA